jgi:hypothetical protein
MALKNGTPQQFTKVSSALLGMLMLCVGWLVPATEAAPVRREIAGSPAMARDVRLDRIVSVLASRLPDPELSERARAKLITLNDQQIGLAAALAERVASEAHGAVAETAFLLLTVLIVVS